jgi:HEAT repeat protein
VSTADPLSRLALIWATGLSRDPAALPILEAQLDDIVALEALRQAALSSIADLATPASDALVVRTLGWQDSALRERAAMHVAQRHVISARDALANILLTSEHPGERRAAMIAMAQLGPNLDRTVRERLIGWLQPDQPMLASHAAWTLAACGDHDTTGRLAALSADPRCPTTLRAQLASALALGDTSATAALVRLLADEELHVREQALLAIAAHGDPLALRAIQEHLLAAEPRVRALAAWVFGELSTADADRTALRLALRDEASIVRALAAAALARHQDPTLNTTHLTAALAATAFPFAAARAAEALAQRGDNSAFAPLLAALDSNSSELAAAAARALARLGDRRSVAALAGKLCGNDPAQPLIEAAAADALLTLQPDHARAATTLVRNLPALIALLASPEPGRRRRAADILRRRVADPLELEPADELRITSGHQHATAWRVWYERVHATLAFDSATGVLRSR